MKFVSEKTNTTIEANTIEQAENMICELRDDWRDIEVSDDMIFVRYMDKTTDTFELDG